MSADNREPEHADEMEQIEQEAADLLELHTGYREPDAGGEATDEELQVMLDRIENTYITETDAPADGARLLTPQEIKAVTDDLNLTLEDINQGKMLDWWLAAQDAKTERFWKAKVAAAEEERDHWESNVAKAVDQLEAALEVNKQLREALRRVNNACPILPSLQRIVDAALGAKEAQNGH